MTISAEVVADSRCTATGCRITSMLLVYPRIIHSELMTHRAFSRNAASSRAIPVERMIGMVEENPAMPVEWGTAQRGMQAIPHVAEQPAPYATVGNAVLYMGDARDPLPLPDGSVHCVVTSPPYWGLRDYGTAMWIGGDPACEHEVVNARRLPWANSVPGPNGRGGKNGDGRRNETKTAGGECARCGAVREDRQLGAEATPDEYVANLVAVFRDVRRVLRDDGVLWLNLGDTYAGGGNGGGGSFAKDGIRAALPGTDKNRATRHGARGAVDGIKTKDLVGIPWRVAFALRADGWYLRSDVIWSKPNPMPESVTDRPTKAHEYVFLLTKCERYFYDAEAVKEEAAESTRSRAALGKRPISARHAAMQAAGMHGASDTLRVYNRQSRNRRSVWEIATKPFPGAHFATFPPELARTCILAGTSARGCCPTCGAPWARVVEKVRTNESNAARAGTVIAGKGHATSQVREGHDVRNGPTVSGRTVGWEPMCSCAAAEPIPCTVLDPFNGAGTTGAESLKMGRAYIGRDLSESYLRDLTIPRLIEAAGSLFVSAAEDAVPACPLNPDNQHAGADLFTAEVAP